MNDKELLELAAKAAGYRYDSALAYARKNMNDLLKRIDEYAAEGCDWYDTYWLINASYRYLNVPEPSQLHCLAYSLAKQTERLLLTNEVLKGQNADYATEVKRQDAEIERLEGQNISLRYELDVLNESGAGSIQQLQARIAELEKPYIKLLTLEWDHEFPWLKEADLHKVMMAESLVIKRYNEQRSVKWDSR